MAEQNEAMKDFSEIIEAIMALPDTSLNSSVVESYVGMVNGAFTDKLKADVITEVLKKFQNEHYSYREAENEINGLKNSLNELIQTLEPSPFKEEILRGIFQIFVDIYDESLARYHGGDITLPICLDEGAQVPSYAHDTDACADLYAFETTVIPAHSYGTKVRTGVKIALPTRWVAMIFPRSSIGAKTPLRLSNSVGIIDSDYRGELGVLYDNTSDNDYTINAGDRIAQLMVMPSYSFTAKLVDTLDETERGEGGFGSTGE